MTTIKTIKMPDIGEGVVEGEVVRWLKEIGDHVEKDEAIVIVMTDKATVELPTPYSGMLVKKYYSEGTIAIKDQPLYDIETSIPTEEKTNEINDKKEIFIPEKKTLKKDSQKVLATPQTRALAKELNIDIHQVIGTGKDHRITNEDVKNSLSRAYQVNDININEDRVESLIGIPKKMAEKMVQSHREIVPFSYFESVDATRLITMKNKFLEKGRVENIHVTFIPFLIKAISLTINKFPKLNSSIDMQNNTLIFHKEHHIGIAMTTDLGLIVPVLKSVEKMNLEEIIRSYTELKINAKNKKLNSEDMKNSTFTISNFGVLGNGLWATPVINYPEVAILAISKIHKQPLVKNAEIIIKDILNLSWTFDHRVIDGDTAAKISHFFSELLENPVNLL